jgi:hypothetical protein
MGHRIRRMGMGSRDRARHRRTVAIPRGTAGTNPVEPITPDQEDMDPGVMRRMMTRKRRT